MKKKLWTQDEIDWLLHPDNQSFAHSTDMAKAFYERFGAGRSITSIQRKRERLRHDVDATSERPPAEARSPLQTKWKETKKKDTWVIEANDSRIETIDDAIARSGADMDIWELEKAYIGAWDVTLKVKHGDKDRPVRSQNHYIRIVLKRKVPESVERAVDRLLERLRKRSPKVKLFKRTPIIKLPHRHALEICLMDPHYGLRAFTPGSDLEWSPQLCGEMVLNTFEEIVQLSRPYAPFEQVVMPMGNDFFHTDSLWQTTTAGTPQPEAEAYLHTFIGGEALAIEIVDRVKVLAPVILYFIPGNHDRATSFMLGRVLRAYYANDKNVTVHADESPYKFHRYGTNLIGYEHGHSVQPVRLAALMANECPDDWAATKHGYREWHLGDQHRKGSSRPSMMEEQGVSVEYLPGITAPNEWHKLKGFNWQKRSTMAFVWHHDSGPIARLQVNVDRRINKIMGRTT